MRNVGSRARGRPPCTPMAAGWGGSTRSGATIRAGNLWTLLSRDFGGAEKSAYIGSCTDPDEIWAVSQQPFCPRGKMRRRLSHFPETKFPGYPRDPRHPVPVPVEYCTGVASGERRACDRPPRDLSNNGLTVSDLPSIGSFDAKPSFVNEPFLAPPFARPPFPCLALASPLSPCLDSRLLNRSAQRLSHPLLRRIDRKIQQVDARRARREVVCTENAALLKDAFPMFVPSLSWQHDHS
jgi:hypothetical protein